MSYVSDIMELVTKRNPGEREFHQAVKEVLQTEGRGGLKVDADPAL